MDRLNIFLLGANVVACAAIGLFFLRYWKQTRDRLLGIFAVAFWVMGINWLVLAFVSVDEVRTALYGVRFLAFVLILWGIWEKNRGPAEGR